MNLRYWAIVIWVIWFILLYVANRVFKWSLNGSQMVFFSVFLSAASLLGGFLVYALYLRP